MIGCWVCKYVWLSWLLDSWLPGELLRDFWDDTCDYWSVKWKTASRYDWFWCLDLLEDIFSECLLVFHLIVVEFLLSLLSIVPVYGVRSNDTPPPALFGIKGGTMGG